MQPKPGKSKSVIKVGSIVIRSDGARYIIVWRDYLDKLSFPSGVTPIAHDSLVAQDLLNKHVGDSFFLSDHTIAAIHSSNYESIYAAAKKRKAAELRKAEAEARREQARQAEIERQRLQQLEAEKERRAQQAKVEEELQRQRAKLARVELVLSEFNFIEADQLAHLIPLEDYRKLKARYVQKWFTQSVTYGGESYAIDDEQARAVIDHHKNTIVAARAGSGKTRTIVAKIIFLIAKYDLDPSELLVFVFNRNAANEINDRLNRIRVNGRSIITESDIATTFHSFARKIVYSICGESDKYGQILAEDKTHFIQAIIEKMPRKKIYEFFRSESLQIKRDKFNSPAEYYEAVRNSSYETLKGEKVKSEAEKIIADFLFEHGIKYYYENEYYLNSAYSVCRPEHRRQLYELKNKFQQESIKPDFYLADYNIPWEHWAVNGQETPARRNEIDESGAIGDYATYLAKMQWKKWFYSLRWLDYNAPVRSKYTLQFRQFQPLIETYKSANTDRTEFERQIKNLLTSRGVKCEKRPEDELINEVWNSQVKRFTKMVTQFIDRAEQQFLDNQPRLEHEALLYDGDPRVKAFLEISLQCYKYYLAYLSGQLPRQNLLTRIIRNNKEEILNFDRYGIDFSLLIQRAAELIETSDNYDIEALLSSKKYILIDEYQDFSQLFLKMTCIIRKLCPDAKLFVVGDDWQAINRFAGSDVDYFKNFVEYFPREACQLEINKNYRCDYSIVNNASAFVENSLHEFSHYTAASSSCGKVSVLHPDKVKIAYKTTSDDADNVFKRNMQISAERNPSKASVQYLKLVTEIIRRNVDYDSFLILHRNNDTSFWFIDLPEFCKRLKRAVTELRIMSSADFDEKVHLCTMHRAKGLEADVVIILEADEGIIPSYHQDTPLYEIFGETPRIALEDQKRLFYVAITRAKHRLYILHKSQNSRFGDGFIGDLDSQNLSIDRELQDIFEES